MKINVLVFFVASMLLSSGAVYAKNDKAHGKESALPPGLQKNYERGKPLPPGWQKKLSPGDVLDRDVYTRGQVIVPLGKDGSISIKVDETIIKLNEKTREIIKILGQ